ncbi:hypothetical protein J4558_26025 [Leptolyngbya sp. 15MV]|nr:hypothetical protein J4558_26025 [Leptolyngbya sp. 15MV]
MDDLAVKPVSVDDPVLIRFDVEAKLGVLSPSPPAHALAQIRYIHRSLWLALGLALCLDTERTGEVCDDF